MEPVRLKESTSVCEIRSWGNIMSGVWEDGLYQGAVVQGASIIPCSFQAATVYAQPDPQELDSEP